MPLGMFHRGSLFYIIHTAQRHCVLTFPQPVRICPPIHSLLLPGNGWEFLANVAMSALCLIRDSFLGEGLREEFIECVVLMIDREKWRNTILQGFASPVPVLPALNETREPAVDAPLSPRKSTIPSCHNQEVPRTSSFTDQSWPRHYIVSPSSL